MPVAKQLLLFALLFLFNPAIQCNTIPDNIYDVITTTTDPRGPQVANLFNSRVMASETAIAIRYAMLVAICRYEVVAACHPVALSFFGKKRYVPKKFCDSRDSRAILTGLTQYNLLLAEHPADGQYYGRYLSTVGGLDILDESRDVETLNGWAHSTADDLIQYFKNDGWNSQGDLTSDSYPAPFDDPTDYVPKNRADIKPEDLEYPLRWQPLTMPSDKHGEFASQIHIVPHVGINAKPLVLTPKEVDERQAKSPYSEPNREGTLSKNDTETVLGHINNLFEMSRKITAREIKLAHWWESKFLSLGVGLFYYEAILDFSRDENYRLLLGEMMAQHDAVLVSWKEKRRHDLARPTTLIRRLLKGQKVKAYRGYGKGIDYIDAEEWEPLIPIQPHSEFPSGSATVCAASFEHMEVALTAYLKNETIPPFQFVITDTFTPHSPVSSDIQVKFDTLKEAGRSCGESRLHAGVHFPPAVDAGYDISEGIGKAAYAHVTELFEGRVPENCLRCKE